VRFEQALQAVCPVAVAVSDRLPGASRAAPWFWRFKAARRFGDKTIFIN
jgi:hypothetical protein